MILHSHGLIPCVNSVAAVRLMRIEFGGAYADLLNERGKGSGNNEMEYVERTLGFRTNDLNEKDLRLVLYSPSFSSQNSFHYFIIK